MLLRPLPYEGADRIVRIYEDAPGAPDDGMRPMGLTKVELGVLRSSSWTLSHAGIYETAHCRVHAQHGHQRRRNLHPDQPDGLAAS